MDAALAVTGLSKRYGATHALRGIDLEVAPGELVGVLGPNGAGKSTLVKIACGLVRASGGEARICGAPAGSPAARGAVGYLAERAIAYLLGVPALASVAFARRDL